MEYLLRYKSLLENRFQNISELMDFNETNVTPATFFIGVNTVSGRLLLDEKPGYFLASPKGLTPALLCIA